MKLFSTQEQNQMKSIFIAAGKKLLHLRGATRLHSKSVGHATGDVVTEADFEIENFLLKELKRAFPTIGFYSEETAKESTQELKKDRVWIVDPIDGTLNFTRDLPFFAVGTGLYVEGKPAASCIYFPVFDELYWAMKDIGSYKNTQKNQASITHHPTEVVLVLSDVRLTPKQQAKLYTLLAKPHFTTKSVGCAHFHAAYTATGQYDVWIGINQALWDMAPGQSLISEAGGAFAYIKMDQVSKALGIPYHHWFITGNPKYVKELAPELKNI